MLQSRTCEAKDCASSLGRGRGSIKSNRFFPLLPSFLLTSTGLGMSSCWEKVLKNVHPQVIVFLGSTSLVGLCAYPVFKKDERAGHDLFSSERPEAIREAQEAQRQEYRRLIKEQRQQIAEEQELIRQRAQERKNL